MNSYLYTLANSLIQRILKVRRDKKNVFIREIAKESDGLTLLDIGSAGDIEPRWLPIAETLNYIGVEPDERSSSLLSNLHNCKSYNIINSLVWSEKKELSFNLCRKPSVSSVFRPNNELLDRFPNPKMFEIVDTVSVESSTLDIELGDVQVDFAKLDIQGAELFALKGMQNHLPSCLGLEIEVEFSSLYERQPLFGEVSNYLNDFGFEFIDFTSLIRWERNGYNSPLYIYGKRYTHNSYGQSLCGDGLWMRSPEDVAKNFSNKCFEYILICTLYGRFDLVQKIIEIAKPKLSKNYKTSLDILINNQKRTRKTHLLFNYLIKFIYGESTVSSRLFL